MNTAEFLQAILPASGYYFLAELIADKGLWKHHDYKSADKLAAHADALSKGGRDAYFALASFEQRAYKSSKGRWQHRTQENVHAIQCQALDLDVGSGKSYSSQAEALQALGAFVKDTGFFAPSLIVNSGRGIHVYWLFDEPVENDPWRHVASKFKKLVKQHLATDIQVTGDSARVLRPIGTFNYKDPDDPKPVTLLRGNPDKRVTFDDWANRIDVLLNTHITDTNTDTNTEVADANSALMSGLDAPQYSYSVVQAAKHCPMLAAMQADNGASQDEPEWHAALGVIAFGEQGDLLAHEWSSGHADYSEHETDRKLEAIRNNQSGPTLCTTISERSSHCDGCTNTCKSPLHLARRVPVNNPISDAPEIPTRMQYFFRWTGAGLECCTSRDEAEGEKWITICNQFPVCEAIYYDAQEEEHIVQTTVYFPSGSRMSAQIPAEVFGQGASALCKELARRLGIVSITSDKYLAVYMKTWMDHIRSNYSTRDVYSHLGWQDDYSFLLGAVRYNTDGTTEPVSVTRAAHKMSACYQSGGSFERYKEILDDVFNRPGRESLQYLVMSAFASPLVGVAREGENIGLVTSAWGNTGLGKTFAALMGMMAFGKTSDQYLVINAGNATEHGTITAAGNRHSLPIFYDEASMWDADRAGKFAYNYSSGVPKLQGAAAGGLRDNSHLCWRNIAIVTANKSLHAEISQRTSAYTEAQLYRLFEFKVPDRNLHSELTRRHRQIIDSEDGKAHYGHAGDVFVRYVVQNRQAVRNRLQEVSSFLTQDAELGAPERYWLLNAACNVVAFEVTQLLGIHQFDKKAYLQWVISTLRTMAAGVKQVALSAEEYLSNMMRELHSGLLLTESWSARVKGGNTMEAEAQIPKVDITGRVVRDTGEVYIPISVVRNWCSKQGLAAREFASLLQQQGLLLDTDKRVYIGKDTPVSLPRVRTWVLKLNDSGALQTASNSWGGAEMLNNEGSSEASV